MKRLLSFLLVSFFVGQTVAQSFRNEWIDYSKTYFKFKYYSSAGPNVYSSNRGLVRIPQSALAAVGLQATPAEYFQLWKDGNEVPLYTSVATGPLTASDYIEFWGENNNGKLDKDLYRDPEFQLNDVWSLQADTASYFITVNTSGSNKRLVETPNLVAGNTLQPTQYFMASALFAGRNDLNPGFAAQASGQQLYSSSYDRGEGWVASPIRPDGSDCGGGGLSFTFNDLKPYAAGPSMSLKINSVGNAPNARSVLVTINGSMVSNYQMDYYYDAKVEEVGIPVSKISSGAAQFYFKNESVVSCDEFRLATTELIYPRTLDCNNNTNFELQLPVSATGYYLKFYNFNHGANTPILYDITNGKRYVGDLSIADTIQFVTEALPTAASFVLVNSVASNATSINSFETRNFIDYGSVSNQGDYLIISNPLIYGSGSNNYVEQYKQYRSSANGGSFNVKVVDINELSDQFALGVKKHPLAIRNFLRYARSHFANLPKFVFLIGKGVVYNEYRDNSGNPEVETLNLVPTWGSPGSDNLLSANDNTNATPITPIGRLSVVTANEIGDYLNKVKQYDSVQRGSLHTITDKAWMKNVLQVAGTNDYNVGTQLDGYLNRYKAIIQDTAFGANVKNYDKIDDPAGYSASIRDFRATYEQGASIVTYFGHSSATNLDFSLDNPNNYNNQYRYPIFIVNGCDAGNLFSFDEQRFNLKSTISEKFILEPERGAIGYLATTGFGVINYLDSFTRKFYTAITKTQYNKSFGEVTKQGIGDVLNTTGSTDYFARMHSEQFVFHGDPALKINGFDKPDYAVEAQQMVVRPAYISVADDSFYVKVRVYNLGRKTADSVNLKLTRRYPNGNTVTVLTKKIAPINIADSVMLALPIVANRDKGNSALIATADYTNSIDEVTKVNNTDSVTVVINDDEIRPVYPYKYAIVNDAAFKLAASTANPLAESKTYVVEVDTTTFFNSPIKFTQTKTSVGGVIEFDKGITLQNNTTYYWRVAPQAVGAHWNVSSFTYGDAPASTGFGQMHFYQHTDSKLDRLILDSTSRSYKYASKINNLFILHSIYPTSGLTDQQFSIQVNGSGIIASACLGQSVIINVFDTLTFKPWVNTTNPFGAEPTCDVSRQYNFEYHYIDQPGRDSAKSFLQSIPKGTYVAVRLVYDGDPVWADQWANDTLVTGSNNSLYHFLKSQGLPIDSFNKPRTFGFVFKKNDSTHFSPRYQFTQGVYDRVVMNVDCNSSDTLGYVFSPKFGPAKAWKKAKWSGTANPNNLATVDVIGVGSTGTETKLYTLTTGEQDFDISAVSATQYPFIKLKLKNQDSITAIPYQLSNWSVEYDGVAEGALAPNLYLNIPDTSGTGGLSGDTLKGGIAFKNVSKLNFDSLTVKLQLTNLRLGTVYTYNLHKTKPLIAGDTVNINYAIDVASLSRDNYNLYFVVNEGNAQPEQYSFNNFLYKYVYLKTGQIVPVRLISFNAKQYGGIAVDADWNVSDEVNLKSYEVEHSTNAINFAKIGTVAAKGATNATTYTYRHNNPVIGKNYYRLKMLNNDGGFTYSPIRMVNFGRTVTVNVYPNPVSDKLNITVNKPDNTSSTVRLINSFGQQMLTKTFTGTTDIDMKGFAAGTYVIQVNDGTETKIIKIQKQ